MIMIAGKGASNLSASKTALLPYYCVPRKQWYVVSHGEARSPPPKGHDKQAQIVLHMSSQPPPQSSRVSRVHMNTTMHTCDTCIPLLCNNYLKRFCPLTVGTDSSAARIPFPRVARACAVATKASFCCSVRGGRSPMP